MAWQGYGVMFTGLAGIWAALPLLGVFGLKDTADARPGIIIPKNSGIRQGLGERFYLVLVFSFVSATAINITQLGRSFSM